MSLAPPAGYALVSEVPCVGDYLRLRHAAGLSPFSTEAARAGLPGTFAGIVVRCRAGAVGMGRVVGDGGLFFQLVDIAVDPAHQGKGLGKAIVAALMNELAARVAAPAYVSLVADGRASELYAQYGFAPVAPKSQGMATWLQPASRSSAAR